MEFMINNIIFSKNRASQLRLLLESIKINCPDTFNITVLYYSSDNFYEEGYEKLKKENILPNVNWIKQSDFKNNVLQMLQTNSDYSCFGVDDDIFFKPFDENIIRKTMIEGQDIFTFSLRLGKNVNTCYTMKCSNVLIPLEENNGVVKFDWTKHYADFSYPLSLDMHIFRTKEILKLTKAVTFNNPNEYEGGLQIFNNFPKYKMACFPHNVVVNSPANRVQDTCPNRFGEQYGFSEKELNMKYLNNEVVDYESLDFSNIIGCHQELKFGFKKI